MPLSQAGRQFAVFGDFADGDLVLRRMQGSEQLGRPFQFDLELISENLDYAIDDLLGTTMYVELDLGDDVVRQFHGLAAECGQLTTDGAHAVYRVVLRPWLWLLSKTSDCRIFQELSVLDIIKQVFGDHGFSDYRDDTQATYAPREYVVQYRETDFNFVSRLMEEAGIFYYFEHTDSNHTLVLSDDSTGLAASALWYYATVPYYPPQANSPRERDHLDHWRVHSQVRTGGYTLRDYNFLTSTADLTGATQSPGLGGSHNAYEFYDSPGGYLDGSQGQSLSDIRLQQLAWQEKVMHGGGTVRGLAAGMSYTLELHPRADLNQDYVIVASSYEMSTNAYEMQQASAPTDAFRCEISAIPFATPFRTPSRTPKPLISGPQSAKVVGPSDQEIYTDEHGRIKVQFPWDREGEQNENSSCWIRVAQTWAGPQWGSIFLPRIGHEVLVEFLEGDPDRPLVTGRVYNDVNQPPYTLPDNMTQSGVKSRSSLEGTADNFNELRFEDKKDEEHVFFQAERDFQRLVKNNDTLTVGLETQMPGDQTVTIFNNQTLTIGVDECDQGDQTTTIWKNQQVTIGASEAEGDQTVSIWKNQTVTVGASESEGDQTTTIYGSRSCTLTTGDDSLTIDQGSHETTVAQGDLTVTATAGSIKIEAGTEIELVVGSSSIKIEAAKITIASVEIELAADASLTASGATAEVSGDGPLTLSGGIVQIN